MKFDQQTHDALENTLQDMLRDQSDCTNSALETLNVMSAQIADLVAAMITGAREVRDSTEIRFRLSMNLAHSSGKSEGQKIGRDEILSLPVADFIKAKQAFGYDDCETVSEVMRESSSEAVKHIAKVAHLECIKGGKDD